LELLGLMAIAVVSPLADKVPSIIGVGPIGAHIVPIRVMIAAAPSLYQLLASWLPIHYV
jgi:hypothetical protein